MASTDRIFLSSYNYTVDNCYRFIATIASYKCTCTRVDIQNVLGDCAAEKGMHVATVSSL